MSGYFNCGEFECRKRKEPERPSNCPACPPCRAEQSGGTTVQRPGTGSTSSRPGTGRVGPRAEASELFNDIGFPEETLGQPTFEEEAAMNEPITVGNTQINFDDNDEYEDEADQWFSKSSTTDPPTDPVPGCMDPTATNYNALATVSDGSCIYPPVTDVKGYTTSFTILSAPMSQHNMINAVTAFSNSDSRIRHQGVDGIIQNGATNIYNYDDPKYQWDGVPLDTTGKTKSELCAFVKPDGPWPSNFIYKGLLQRYREVQPFADEVNPTVDEINTWNIEVINHFRKLLGIPGIIQPDARLYIECRLSDERKYTTAWDTAYPLDTCPPGSGSHCGWLFFPSADERAPYLANTPYNNDFVKYPELTSFNTKFGLVEGISPVHHWVPWGVKLAYILTEWICKEGLVGHPGPYFNPTTHRQFIGMSWWYNPPATGGAAFYRAQYR